MSYTYFILASENEISQLENVDEVMSLIEKEKPLLGGFYSLEALTNLGQVFLKVEKGEPIPTKYVWNDESRFYVFHDELCQKVSSTEWHDLLQASVPWCESEPWKSVEHNSMDLAGMIIEFAELCKQTNNEKHLYFLLSNED